MTGPRCLRFTAVSLIALFVVYPANAQSAHDKEPALTEAPALVNTCLVTKNMKEMVKFYAAILKRDAQMSGEDYAEFHTNVGALAIFSAEAQERYIPGSATAASNRSIILEFRVADVDGEYQRLRDVVKIWVKPPTTQPWGTRSIYFRDPDGNLIDFYSRPDSK
ncbi:MAG TPA: VOC family protein [Terracidiphilus sp.]|nr:VOC family protein [Terracidiphilus sp.]